MVRCIHLGGSEAVVRDLASGAPFAHQDWIYCDNDDSRQILVVALGFTAPGITTVAPGEPHAAPAIQRAKITFALSEAHDAGARSTPTRA